MYTRLIEFEKIIEIEDFLTANELNYERYTINQESKVYFYCDEIIITITANNEFQISYNFSLEPDEVAIITLKINDFCNDMGYQLEIFESFYFDSNNDICFED